MKNEAKESLVKNCSWNCIKNRKWNMSIELLEEYIFVATKMTVGWRLVMGRHNWGSDFPVDLQSTLK